MRMRCFLVWLYLFKSFGVGNTVSWTTNARGLITLTPSLLIIYATANYWAKTNINSMNPKMLPNRNLHCLSFLLLLTAAYAQLRVHHYRHLCPNVEAIVHSAVKHKFQETFVTAPATLRLFFHDCFVRVFYLFLSSIMLVNVHLSSSFCNCAMNIGPSPPPLVLSWVSAMQLASSIQKRCVFH